MVGGVYIISAGVRLQHPGPGLQEPRLLDQQLRTQVIVMDNVDCIKIHNEVIQQFPGTWAWLLIMAASCFSITLLLWAAIGPGEAADRGGSGTGTLRI